VKSFRHLLPCFAVSVSFCAALAAQTPTPAAPAQNAAAPNSATPAQNPALPSQNSAAPAPNSAAPNPGSVPQAPSGALAFDVATIKPSAPLDFAKLRADMQAGKPPRLGPHVDAARAEYIYMTLKQLIAIAWHVKEYQIEGPDWLGEQRFDIEATLPAGATKDDAPAMLKSLLQDRFEFQAHPATEEHKVLALIVGKDGPKLKETPAPAAIDENAPLKPGEQQMDGPDGPVRILRNPDGSTTINMGDKGVVVNRFDGEAQALRIESSGVTMAGFAEILTRILQVGGTGGPQVVDQTGLKGYYVVETEIPFADLIASSRQATGQPPPAASGGAASASGAPTASDPTGGQTIFASVEKLGLKLDERKAPVEELVVDHIDKTPTAN
jgi:uncharacterized protein (TIGR03435 family)